MADGLAVGFIGLGNIGGPMASNMLDGGRISLTVYDVAPQAMQALVDKGARAAASPRQLAAENDIIGICVRDDKDVDAVLLGDEGVLAGARGDSIIAVHSTVTRDGLRRWHQAASERGIHLIDAPITGGAHGAVERQLCYMVGGPAELLERCRPVFETSAEKIVHTGDFGTGLALKLCNNIMTYAGFTAAHEATKLAEACGLSFEVLYEVGQANGVITDQMHRFISNRENLIKGCSPEDFQQLFGPFATLGEKDLDAALETAEQQGTTLPVTEKIRELIVKIFLKQC